ncbi:MAG: tetratricopeptide repeat protein [Candidatus Zixiibacteriota bacterium]
MLKNLLILAMIVFIAGCSQGLYNQGKRLSDKGEYEKAVDVLYQEISANPKNADAWRELGVAFFKKGEIAKAEEALQQANNIRPDARTNLFRGMILEKNGQVSDAITAYGAALGLNLSSDTRRLIQGRLDYLIKENIKSEVNFALDNEAKISADTIPINSIAVVDFDNSHLPAELAPISKGLAEFTALDLAKVSSLKVVDRLKIDELLKELQLTQSGYVDPGNAPRVGRLIGSSRIITGSLVGLGDDGLRLDGAIVSTRDSLTKMTEPTEATTQEFFKLQKAFVFDIIDNLGVTLTAAERDAIEEVPTESFLAFMAFCRGLDYESKGQIQDAKQQYTIAARNDVGFKQAGEKRTETNRQLSASDPALSGSVEQFESDVVSTESSEIEGALDQFQTINLNVSGFLRDITDFGATQYSPLRSLIGENVIIIIRGDFDAAN